MTDPQTTPIPPDAAEQFEKAMTEGPVEDAERTQHEQRVARERRADKRGAAGDDRWGPTGDGNPGV